MIGEYNPAWTHYPIESAPKEVIDIVYVDIRSTVDDPTGDILYVATQNGEIHITGVPSAEFDKYLPHFTAAYYELYPSENASGRSWQQSLSDSLQDALSQMEDKLLFIWMSHSCKLHSQRLSCNLA